MAREQFVGLRPLMNYQCCKSKSTTYIVSPGSSLFSVELELGQAELARHQIEHGDEMRCRAVAARLALGRAEHTVQSFQERIGPAPFPVRQAPGQMFLDLLCH